jgi:serine protease Do
MPFPVEPQRGLNEPEDYFTVQDPFGLRKAVTPVFVRDLRDGMFTGCGTSFFITPFGRQLSAMHIATDFLNERGIAIRPGSKSQIQTDDARIGILHDPGLVYGTRPAGEVLYVSDFVMFPVDQTKHPLAFSFSAERLGHVEPELDLMSWQIGGLSDRKTTFLPIRIAGIQTVKAGDRLMAVGYPEIKSWRRPGAQLLTYAEEMRASVGRVIETNDRWEPDEKIWPTIVVDARWDGGMSGGPIFNESGEVVGIVSRGLHRGGAERFWGRGLWLEPLPYRSDIFGCVDYRISGWVTGWVARNAKSAIELFETREAAEKFVSGYGPGLTVERASTPSTVFRRPDQSHATRRRDRGIWRPVGTR